MPQNVRELGDVNMDINVEGYRNFWKKAKETISCYPGKLFFTTIKAGATSEKINKLKDYYD